MSELEQLKADLAAFERVRECSGKYGCNHGLDAVRAIAKIESKIKELEVPPDPWQAVKKDIEVYKINGSYRIKRVANYCQHLQSEVERLGSELANRPVVWCLKSKDDEIILTNWKSCYALFESSVAAEAFRSRNNYNHFEPAIYTEKKADHAILD